MLLHVLGKEIEFERVVPVRPRSCAPAIVFLHEALGSVSLWRDFPKQIADATGCEAVVYSRHGYGGSTPRPEPFASSYLHDEALVWLPAILDALGVDRPFLFGHSDGGSIALIHAGGAGRPVSGLIVLAPHVTVEDKALAGIDAAKHQHRTTDLGAPVSRVTISTRRPSSGDGTRSGRAPSTDPGTSRDTCRRSAARFSPSRATRTSTGRWTSSTGLPARPGTSTW